MEQHFARRRHRGGKTTQGAKRVLPLTQDEFLLHETSFLWKNFGMGLTTKLCLIIFVISFASLSAYASDLFEEEKSYLFEPQDSTLLQSPYSNSDPTEDPNNPATSCYTERCNPYSEYQNPYSEYQNPYSEKYTPSCKLTGAC